MEETPETMRIDKILKNFLMCNLIRSQGLALCCELNKPKLIHRLAQLYKPEQRKSKIENNFS